MTSPPAGSASSAVRAAGCPVRVRLSDACRRVTRPGGCRPPLPSEIINVDRDGRRGGWRAAGRPGAAACRRCPADGVTGRRGADARARAAGRGRTGRDRTVGTPLAGAGRGAGAASARPVHDPFFAYRHDPRRRPTAALRDAAIRLCERINVNPPWLHRDPCKYGADIGLNPRTHGWLIERGLALAQLDRYTAARHPAYRYTATDELMLDDV